MREKITPFAIEENIRQRVQLLMGGSIWQFVDRQSSIMK
jgi:hypothetical protein